MPYRSDTYARVARQKSEKLRRIAEVGLIEGFVRTLVCSWLRVDFQARRASEYLFAADGALRVLGEFHATPFHGQAVKQQEAANRRLAGATDYFQCFGRLHGTDDAGERSKDTHHRAARFLGIVAFRWAYWNMLFPGRPIPLPAEMSMTGKTPAA